VQTGVEQTVATVPGAQYLLSFYLGSVNNAAYPGSGNASAVVLINGSSIGVFTNSNASGLSANWQLFFTATGSTTTFDFFNNAIAGVALAGLDNVQMTPLTQAATRSIPTLSHWG